MTTSALKNMQNAIAQRRLKLLGQRIRVLRHSRQFSQEELAARAGIHPTYLSALECGKRNPSMGIFFSLAEALNVEPSELLKPSRQAKARGAVCSKPGGIS